MNNMYIVPTSRCITPPDCLLEGGYRKYPLLSVAKNYFLAPNVRGQSNNENRNDCFIGHGKLHEGELCGTAYTHDHDNNTQARVFICHFQAN